MRHTFSIPNSIDNRPLPFKEIVTTGSISASSNQITVASAAGLTIGDGIIIAVGGEAGAGMRGTVGVGGTWPALSYANATAMNADSSKAANTLAWLQDTKNVYQYVSGVWTPMTALFNNYYLNKVVPRALVTTITNIVGSVLTLADTASVSATGANVYFDNYPVFAATYESGVADVSYAMPAGRFAFSERFRFGAGNRVQLHGVSMDDTILLVPAGVFSLIAGSGYVASGGVYDTIFRDFAIEGNALNNGFGLWVTETEVQQGTCFSSGVVISGNRGIIKNIKVTDVFQMSAGFYFSQDVLVHDCISIRTVPERHYIQWAFQGADSLGGRFVDCRVDAAFITHGFELFRCDGGAIIRPVGRNAAISMNSTGGDWLIDAPDLTIEANSQFIDEDGFAPFNNLDPIININSNISPPSGSMIDGGEIRNPRIIQEGAVSVNGNILTSINLGGGNPNISVLGGYPDNPSQGGYIEHTTGTLAAASGVNATGTNPVVDGIRVKGTNLDSGFGNIHVGFAVNAIVRNCVADVIVGGTQTNNQTNADYDP